MEEPGLAPGLRPSPLPGGAYVSPMPRLEDLERLAEYPTVLSLATPAEYAFTGAPDPRTIQSIVEKMVWLPTGEYNAPPLPKLARAVEEAGEPRPVLIHCFRGCGRSSAAAAAWLARWQGMKPTEALATVASSAGCGVETMPQETVVEAYGLLLAAGVGLSRFDPDDPVPEYVALLASRLHWLRGDDPVGLAGSQLLDGGPIRDAAAEAARLLGYTVAGMETRRLAGETALVIHVWIPRGAHPAAVKRPAEPPAGTEARLAEILRGYAPVRVEIVVHPPDRPPWL